jgi:hypothetical protein
MFFVSFIRSTRYYEFYILYFLCPILVVGDFLKFSPYSDESRYILVFFELRYILVLGSLICVKSFDN